MDNNINSIINITMENLKKIVDVNTIIGDPIETKDATILPISKVCVGFASGGANLPEKKNSSLNENPFAGGSGSGVSIKPIAFLVVKENTVRLLTLDKKSNYDKLLEQLPNAIDLLSKIIDKKDGKNNSSKEEKDSSSTEEEINEEYMNEDEIKKEEEI
ncbi:GerW family sporulation protein [Clostridium grantii]|uniref:Sporulation protein YtfJ n=1 Tax=Clostridium grantii DSM 8605 TaxID=1121316 RepID=A0A1M5SAH8_9CLOT|nr:GerW family sporulation protein [Clostridium grantii]SHH35499.1 sporulation protein YtfJ [Clostridium grantii DSM 8605]